MTGQCRIRNSWGVYDAYKWLRKRKWQDIGQMVTEHQFYAIIRSMNKALAESLLKGHTVTFPHKMGKLELSKQENKAYLKDGKLVITHPIDWKRTKLLWQEDGGARQRKTLLRQTTPYTYRIKYSKGRANYENKAFYRFYPARGLKTALKEKIQNKETDAIW